MPGSWWRMPEPVASMRPRFMNRGSYDRTQMVRTGFAASMRPRFMNRGSDRGPARSQRRDPRASMRPRFMNRGSIADECEHMGGLVASMRPRFMNRGSVSLEVSSRRGPYGASMRPRFMNRGSDDWLPCREDITMCFNEAPIHESGKSGIQHDVRIREVVLQ